MNPKLRFQTIHIQNSMLRVNGNLNSNILLRIMKHHFSFIFWALPYLFYLIKRMQNLIINGQRCQTTTAPSNRIAYSPNTNSEVVYCELYVLRQLGNQVSGATYDRYTQNLIMIIQSLIN